MPNLFEYFIFGCITQSSDYSKLGLLPKSFSNCTVAQEFSKGGNDNYTKRKMIWILEKLEFFAQSNGIYNTF